jgi:hypothetical protein
MLEAQPTKTFRGTWDEILTHQDEIPSGSVIELRVFEPNVDETADSREVGDFGGLTVYEVFKDVIGTVNGLPVDLAEHAEEYLAKSDFGVTKNPRTLDK